MTPIEIGARYRFVHRPRGIFPSLIAEHDGKACVAVIASEKWPALGIYYKVKFDDGNSGYAWPEELEPLN